MISAGALKDRAPNYKTVFVLGVGLKKNIAQTIATLMELKTKGVRTVWLSSMPVALDGTVTNTPMVIE